MLSQYPMAFLSACRFLDLPLRLFRRQHSTHASGCTENSAKRRLAAENSANANDINESINVGMLCLSLHTDRP